MVTTPTVWTSQFQVNPPEGTDNFQTEMVFADVGLGRYVGIYNELGDFLGQIYDAEGNKIGGSFQVNQESDTGNDLQIAIASRPDGGFAAVYRSAPAAATRMIPGVCSPAGSGWVGGYCWPAGSGWVGWLPQFEPCGEGSEPPAGFGLQPDGGCCGLPPLGVFGGWLTASSPIAPTLRRNTCADAAKATAEQARIGGLFCCHERRRARDPRGPVLGVAPHAGRPR